jgi:hypothetical protein
MKRTIWLQETRLMRFKEAYGGWLEDRLTQEEAALILGKGNRDVLIIYLFGGLEK